MSTLSYILLFTFLGSILSLVGGLILLARHQFAFKIASYLAAFAAGALLATAFLDLLPEAAELSQTFNVFAWTLVGFLAFFILERSIRWFHHHHEHLDDVHIGKSIAPLILVGDSIHNFIDGVAIAAAFLIDIPLGIGTAIAVGAHEIPQEIGDFGVLLKSGFSRGKVIFYNFITALTALAGALITYYFGASLEHLLPVFLAITAGFFIYIAASDLIPAIHDTNKRKLGVALTLTLIAGVLAVRYFMTLFEY